MEAALDFWSDIDRIVNACNGFDNVITSSETLREATFSFFCEADAREAEQKLQEYLMQFAAFGCEAYAQAISGI